MVSQINRRLRRWRRWISRAYWAARLLRYEIPSRESHEVGLIMVQIDGLSREQFERALARGRLPYLRQLLRGGHFRSAGFYSGVPATTPAVQGEIFYGKKTGVPSFCFRHRETGDLIRMYEAECAQNIGAILSRDVAEPTLAGGTSYSNIYTGGAAEARFCAETMDVESIWTRSHPIKWMFIYAMYFVKFLRLIALVFIEVVIAIGDFLRGLYLRKNLLAELKFIPARAVVCVALREVIQFMTRLDIERGVKIIHANFLGYDEQAHRRGPRSAFAHWTLKGIDRTIRDVHRAALRSEYRDYQLIVYSDHGQETARSYEGPNGETVLEAVKSVVARHQLPFAENNIWHRAHETYLTGRSRELLRRRRRLTSPKRRSEKGADEVVVAAMGPLGHIYLPRPLSDETKEAIARDLVRLAEIPIVFFVSANNAVRAVDGRGEWRLPEDGRKVLGEENPFYSEVIEDLMATCRHVDAGDLVISGWKPGQTPVTFAREAGAHAGPGFRETHGFTLIPDDLWPSQVKEDARGEPYFRGLDLRAMALKLLHRSEPHLEESHDHALIESLSGDSPRLKVVTYNVHSCIGTDGKMRPRRIISLLQKMQPDVVALQEVDMDRPRTWHMNQTAIIASALGMDYVFLPLLRLDREQYGIALLSRYAFTTVKASDFSNIKVRSKEPRGAIWIRLAGPRGHIHVVNTHFGLTRAERAEQLDTITNQEWLGSIPEGEPVVLCGDFNSGENSVICRKLRRSYRDVQLSLCDHVPQGTFVSLWPLLRLDHIFVSRHFKVHRVEVPRDFAPRVASDHLPVFSELELAPNES